MRALRLALKVRFRLGLNDVFATEVGECCVNVMHAISFIWHADKLSHEPRKHRSVGELEGGVYFRLPKYPLYRRSGTVLSATCERPFQEGDINIVNLLISVPIFLLLHRT